MRFVLVPLAGYVLLYAPGHYVLRRTQTATGEASRLLREVLLSACCTSWIGFALAELGCFSLALLLGLVGGLAFVARARHGRTAGRGYGKRDAAGLAVWLIACVWMAPPFDTRLAAADSTGYLASGVHLARHGTLVIHDPTLAKLSVDLKRTLFPSVAPERGVPPYLRLSGSFILRSLDSDEVLPAFHHLITVWIAIADSLGAGDVGEWIITLFAGLSVWAMVECATLFGASAGCCLALLLLSGIQYWYSRFLMPEVPGQFFVWAGLACMASNERSARASDAVLAGLAFGIAGLVRAENAFFLAAGLATFSVLVPPASRRHYVLLLSCAAAIWLHLAIHLSVFRTHYFAILRDLFLAWLPAATTGHVWLAWCVLGSIAALFAWRWFRLRRPQWWPEIDHCLLIGLLLVSLWDGSRGHWSSLRLLVSCLGVPTLLGGGVGLFLVTRRGHHATRAGRLLVLLAALALAQVMLDPHAQPVPIWTARRALTIVLPAACLGLAFFCRTAARRSHWLAAAVLLCAGLVGESSLFWQLRTGLGCYRGATRQVRAIAALLPPGARLLFDGQLIALGLAPTLWAQYDLPAYFFPTGDAERITELATALSGAPLYWVSDGVQPLPRGPGIELTPVALDEFVIATPKLDVDAALGSEASWQMTVALYRLRVAPQNTSAPP